MFSGVFSISVEAGMMLLGVWSGCTILSVSSKLVGSIVFIVVFVKVVAVIIECGRCTCATSSLSISRCTSLHSLSALSFPQTQGSKSSSVCEGVH